jgi:subtilisin family serine protease
MNPTTPIRQGLALVISSLLTHGASAQESLLVPEARLSAVTPSWMHPDVGAAWDKGYKGQGATITVVDDFSGSTTYNGNLGSGAQRLRHGEWTATQAGLIASESTVVRHDVRSAKAVSLGQGLNVVNLSYGMLARAGYSASQIRWSAQETSIIAHAKGGRAVIAKAAGNDGVAMSASNRSGQIDYLNLSLRGAKSAIFVGALDRNGTTASKAKLASYSNTPGTDTVLQKQFLVVGVTGKTTGLNGTSFAAPVISAYAAVLGSKFTAATPTQITTQLLSTARQDTISGYSVKLHGRGEASLSRALAPVSIK